MGTPAVCYAVTVVMYAVRHYAQGGVEIAGKFHVSCGHHPLGAWEMFCII